MKKQFNIKECKAMINNCEAQLLIAKKCLWEKTGENEWLDNSLINFLNKIITKKEKLIKRLEKLQN